MQGGVLLEHRLDGQGRTAMDGISERIPPSHPSCELRIQGIPQAISYQVDGQHGCR
jgi:hypothetical protein